MKKHFILFLVITFGSLANAFANLDNNGHITMDIYQFNCQSNANGQVKHLVFDLNFTTRIINFSNIEAFSGADILANTAFGLTTFDTESNLKIGFDYNWYYTASYSLDFNNALNKLTKGSTTELTLSGDDDDGATFNDVSFSCKIK